MKNAILRFLFTLLAGCCLQLAAFAQITFDGTITETDWGTALSTSAGGPGPGFGAGHEVNAIYLDSDANDIFLGVAGNVQIGNRILVFIDSKSGGYPNGDFGRTGAPQGIDDFNSGTTFDFGFQPDYGLVIGTDGGGNYFFDLFTLSGTAAGGGGSNNFLGDQTAVGLGASPANSSQTQGFEVTIAKTDLGFTCGAIQLMAMYISDGGFLSNQFLTPAGLFDGNYTDGPVVFWVAAPNPISANTPCCPPASTLWYVDASVAPGGTGTSWDCAFDKLQDAIAAANSGDQIWVADGTYYPDQGVGYTPGNRSHSFVMKNNLAIYGGFSGGETSLGARNSDPATNGTILSGDLNGDDVVSGSGSTLSIANNGENAYHVIFNNSNGLGNTAILDGFTVTGGNAGDTNFPGYYGGGMFNSGSSPKVANCHFSGNDSGFGGSGMANISTSSPTLINCTFSGNLSLAGGGGGVFNSGSSPTLTDCSFSGNSAVNGGGMFNDFGSSPMVTDCSFSGNSASQRGGGVFNQASSPTVTNCSFSDNSSVVTGGGMYNSSSSNPTVANCSFSGNSADNGGGVYNASSSPSVTNCSFSGNIGAVGGGMFNASSSPTVTNCSFSGNSADNGGGVYNASSSPSVTNCSFSGNIGAGGGGMFNASSSPTVTNCSFSGNSAGVIGGGMFNVGSSNPTVTNCIFWGNGTEILNTGAGTATGTVIYSIVQGGCPVGATCTDVLDVDPLFVSQPPIMLGIGGDLRLQPCSPAIDAGDGASGVSVNTTTEDLDGNSRFFNSATVDMGAFEYQSTVNICDCYTNGIIYVDADATGANNGTTWANAYNHLQDALANTCPGITQIWVAAGTYYPGTTRSASFVMKNNLAIYGGFSGGETMLSQRNPDPATNGTVLSGDIDQDGTLAGNSYHVINNENNGLNSSAVLDGFTVTGGNANGSGNNQYGGGMSNNSSAPTVTNCSFSGNTASSDGGGMRNIGGGTTVTNCSFSGNSADFGGGISDAGGGTTLTNCSFSGNTASSNGGGMYNSSSSTTVTNCSFSGNSAGGSGGGMYNIGGSPTVTNCSFSGNSASSGGGMSNFIGSPTVTNCSFSGNSASSGGGMSNFIDSPTVTNCILWGNSSQISGDPATVTFSIVQGGYGAPADNNLDVDPLFVSQPPIGLGTTGDLHLQPCSPAKDAGTTGPNVPATDFDGDARPQGGGIDMGFDENGASCSTPELDLRNAADDDDILNGSSLRTVALGTEYGSVCVSGGTVTNTFRAENNGTANLTFGADALALTNTTDFSIVTDLPNGGTLAPGGVATFSIQFDPTTTGTRTCTVTVRSDDADEDPYTFLIGGFGVAEPTTAAAGSDQDVCGTSATLAGNAPTVGTGQWTITAGDGNGYFDGVPGTLTSNNPGATFNGTAGQSYTLRWTISKAPCPASSDDMNISFAANPTMAAAGADQDVCGTSATLAGNVPTVGTGQWTITAGDGNGYFDGVPGTTTSNAPNATFNGTAGQSYTLRWTISNAPCPATSDDMNISFFASPTVAAAGADQDVCGNSTTLAGNVPTVGTGQWTVVAATGGSSFGATSPYTSTSDDPAATFNGGVGQEYTLRWTISNGPCPASFDDVDIDFPRPEVSVIVSPASVDEDGPGNLVYTFTRDCAVDTLTVALELGGNATFNDDYTQSGALFPSAAFGRFQFDFGEATKQVTIDPTPDSNPELDETVVLSFRPLGRYTIGSPSSATGTITDDDSATISIGDVSMDETNGAVNFCFPVTITDLPANDVTLTASTANGSATNGAGAVGQDDYIPKTDILTFNASSAATQQFCVTVKGDEVVELDENFFVNLSNLNANGQSVTFADAQGEGTILNDEQCVISFEYPPSMLEGNDGSTVYPITMNFSHYVDVPHKFTLLLSDGTATAADNDFSPLVNIITVTLNTNRPPDPYPLSSIFQFPAFLGDTKVEPDEFFNFHSTLTTFGRDIVFSTGGSEITIPLTILNDDTDWGDAPDTYGTTNANSGPSHGGSNLKLGATNDGEADGQPSANAEGDGAEDDGVAFTSGLIAGSSASVDVTASATGLLDAWIDFDGNGDFNGAGEQIFASQNLAAGLNSLSFTVPGTAADGSTFARFRLSSAGGLAPTGAAPDGEVEDYQVGIIATMFSIDDPMVDEGDAGTSNLSFTVSRSTNGAASSVNYAITGGTATSGDDYQPLAAGTVNFTAGTGLTQTVNVVVNGDLTVELDETVEMTLSNPVAGIIADGSGTGTITNDDAAALILSSPFITEGDAGSAILTFRVDTDRPVDVPVGFSFATSDGTATLADNDYQAASGSSAIATGEPVAYLQVFQNGDCQIEPDEFFNMTLSGLSANGRDVTFDGGGTSLGNTGAINNDDALPGIYIPAEFTQATDTDQCSATVTVPLASTASLCGSSTLEFRSRQVLPLPIGGWSAWVPEANNTQVFAVGRHEVEWRVTDGSGSSVGNFFFNVADQQVPVPACTAATAALDADGNAAVTTADVFAGGSDNCSATPVPVSVSPNTFTCADLGANTVTLSVQDAAGNPASCTATVTVVDNIAPTAACKDITVQLGADGTASITPADVDNGTGDNCGFVLGIDKTSFDCSEVTAVTGNTITVTLTATDPGGNPHQCTSAVTIVDGLAPTANCQDVTVQLGADGSASVTPAQVDNGSSDNCAVIGQVLDKTGFGCADLGPNTVTLSLQDPSGNPASCTATVTVEDNIAPAPACKDISIALGNSATADIAPADVFDAAGSDDNCGTVTPVGVTPSSFNCGDVGANTVTLTVEDASGNPATCTATVTVEDFVTNIGIQATPEDCAGGNGTITVTASAPAGQVSYSIDGGATWQLTGLFEYLTAGGYEVVVQVYGTSGCVVPSGTATVGSTGSPQTWYQDMDNDGWSNGNTLTQCQRPNGFKLASELTATSGDCNDYNPEAFPGQTWWADLDGDGYGDGTSFVNCTQPAGLYPASSLTSTTGDCDDGDADVNPGAAEVCNGIDDDCDGEIDEGLAGLTYVGNVLFTNQAQVDAFSQCYTVIDGDLTIRNSGVTDLSNLVNLTEVTGNVYIKSTGLTGLAGLDNLATVGGYLSVQFNHSLVTLDGLDAVASVGGYLRVYRNTSLTDCCAIHGLLNSGGVGGSTLIALNDTGCDSVAEVETACAGSSPLVAPNCPDCGPSTASVEGLPLDFDVYPNPATDVLNVRLHRAPETDAEVVLFNTLGQSLGAYNVAAGQRQLRIDLLGNLRGECFVRLSTAQGTEVKKVMVVR